MSSALLSPVRVFLQYLRFRKERTFAEWLRSEMVVVEGSAAGMLFAPRGWQALIVPILSQQPHCWLATPPRAGKTLLAVAMVLYHAIERGETVQVAAPTQELAAGFWFDKILPVILQNRRLKKQIAFDPSLRTLRAIYRFKTGGCIRVIFNPRQIRSYDAACLVATEAATFEETPNETDALTLLQKRQDDWPLQGIQFFESTQRDDCQRFAREIAAGTDSRVECRCRCRKWFEAGARPYFLWRENGEDLEEPVIVCPHCGARYPEKKRKQLLRRQRIAHQHPKAQNFSLTVNWLHTRRTFAEVAALEKRYKEQQEIAVLRDLLQNYYAVPTSKADETPFVAAGNQVSKIGLLEHRGNTPRNVLPEGVRYTVGAIDCQQDWLYVLLAGMDEGGTLSLIQWGTVKILEREQQHQGIVAPPERVIAALDAALAGFAEFHPVGVWVDTSYKSAASQTPLITDWCKSKPGVYKVRGRTDRQTSSMKNAAILPPVLAPLLKPYRAADGTIDMYLNTTQLKNQLAGMILREPGAAAGFALPSDLDPSNHGDNALLLHLTAEEPLARRDGSVEWQKRFGHTGRNDWWDCLVYAYCGLLYHRHLFAPRSQTVPPPKPHQPRKIIGGLAMRQVARFF